MSFVVKREKQDTVSTQGQLLVDGVHYCYTLEPAYPIPAGTYNLTICFSPRFARLMPHVEDVPGHTGILLHWGNWSKDTEGCTLVGYMQGMDFVGHSVDAFNLLFLNINDMIKEGPQTITYVDVDPTQTAANGAGGGK
jgi:hypothetical protein